MSSTTAQPTKSKIRAIRAHEVVVPAHDGATDSPSLGQYMDGKPWDLWPIVVVEFLIDDGITALGEIGRGITLARAEPELKSLIGLTMQGCGLGGVPESMRPGRGALTTSMPPALQHGSSVVLGALEMAMLDWAGKRLNCRAVDLLGGAYADSVPVDYWCGRQVPADLARIVGKARERGFTGLKMKSRLGDPVADQLRAVREAGGEGFRLTIDPMFQWHDWHEAATIFSDLDRHGLEAGVHVRIEDPFPQDRPDLWRRAARASRVPLVFHCRGQDVLRRALMEGDICDAYNCSGGPWEFLTQAKAVELHGFTCWHGSAIELAIAQMSHAHAAAAARSCVLHGDFVSGFVRKHTMTTWDWPYAGGRLPLPPGPGLGVELDLDAIARYRTASTEISG